MITGKLADLVEVTHGSLLSEQAGTAKFTGLSIDSRTIEAGNLFVAIKGEANDGHKYLAQAAEKNAGACIIQVGNEHLVPEHIKGRTLVVADTHKALHGIALWWKSKFHPKIVALTGTNGKTTTKEMIADVLARKFNVFRSPGNLNNLYGIPLSLTLLNSEHEVCVLELGMSYPGEIEILTRMVDPHVALITNIGPAHLETMGTIENIANAKFELLENLDKDSLRILNVDDPILKTRFNSEPQPKMGYAVRADAEIKPTVFSSNSLGRIIFNYADQEIHLNIPGLHNLYNAMAACAVARAFEIDPAEIKAALEKFVGKDSRMQIHNLGSITVIDDSYNANPTSMGYALKALYDMGGKGRKIAVLGDMKELGKEEVNLHHQVGQVVAELDPDKLITVGKLGMQIAAQANADGYDPTRAETYMDTENAIEWLLSNVRAGDHILIKASRAMKFEKILAALVENFKEEG